LINAFRITIYAVKNFTFLRWLIFVFFSRSPALTARTQVRFSCCQVLARFHGHIFQNHGHFWDISRPKFEDHSLFSNYAIWSHVGRQIHSHLCFEFWGICKKYVKFSWFSYFYVSYCGFLEIAVATHQATLARFLLVELSHPKASTEGASGACIKTTIMLNVLKSLGHRSFCQHSVSSTLLTKLTQ